MVVDVAVHARTVPAWIILAAMTTRAGAPFDAAKASANLLRIEALSAFEDVRVGWERSGQGVKVIRGPR